jgi:hypothetical protein
MHCCGIFDLVWMVRHGLLLHRMRGLTRFLSAAGTGDRLSFVAMRLEMNGATAFVVRQGQIPVESQLGVREKRSYRKPLPAQPVDATLACSLLAGV